MPKKYLITLSDEYESKLKTIVKKYDDDLKEQGIPGRVTPTNVVQSMVECSIIGCENLILKTDT